MNAEVFLLFGFPITLPENAELIVADWILSKHAHELECDIVAIGDDEHKLHILTSFFYKTSVAKPIALFLPTSPKQLNDYEATILNQKLTLVNFCEKYGIYYKEPTWILGARG